MGKIARLTVLLALLCVSAWADGWLKQSTAVILKLGPFVDSTDFTTLEAALVIGQADIQISKNGGAFAQTSAVSPVTTYDADGFYPIPLTATDTGTVGTIAVQVSMTGALPVWWYGMVVPANTYALIDSGDYLTVDTIQVEGGDATDALGTAQTGDSYARLGAPAGASVSADVAAIEAQTDDIGVAGAGLTNLGDTRMANLDAAISTRLSAAGYTAPLDAAGVRTAIGLATANLDTQIAALPTASDATLTASHGSGSWTSAVIGAGTVHVNESTLDDSGNDLYFKTSAGAGIGGATITAYVKTEYDTGTFTSRGQTRTLDNGSWRDDLLLDDGIQYVIEYRKAGYETHTTTITVAG